MFADIDLRKLAEMTAPERAFLSVYLAGPRSAAELENKFQKMRRVLNLGWSHLFSLILVLVVSLSKIGISLEGLRRDKMA
jgi:hypothetical protein